MLKAAIIGCGAIAPLHAEAVKSSSGGELAVVVDIEEEKAKASAHRYGCEFSTDYREVLLDSQIDVVHICTPHYLHYDMACAALSHGKHVLIEKPMAMNYAQAEEIWRLAQGVQKHCAVAFQNRFSPQVVRAKEILESGELGDIFGIRGSVNWFRDAAYYRQGEWRGKWATEGGGVLINQSIHTLDLMLLFAGDVTWVGAQKGNYFLTDEIEVEDTLHAALSFISGARGIFFATTGYSRNAPYEVEIHCAKGLVTVTDTTLRVESGDGVEEQVTPINSQYKSYWGTGHQVLVHTFYQAILDEKQPDSGGYPTGGDVLRTQQVVDAIYKASTTGEKVILGGEPR